MKHVVALFLASASALALAQSASARTIGELKSDIMHDAFELCREAGDQFNSKRGPLDHKIESAEAELQRLSSAKDNLYHQWGQADSNCNSLSSPVDTARCLDLAQQTYRAALDENEKEQGQASSDKSIATRMLNELAYTFISDRQGDIAALAARNAAALEGIQSLTKWDQYRSAEHYEGNLLSHYYGFENEYSVFESPGNDLQMAGVISNFTAETFDNADGHQVALKFANGVRIFKVMPRDYTKCGPGSLLARIINFGRVLKELPWAQAPNSCSSVMEQIGVDMSPKCSSFYLLDSSLH